VVVAASARRSSRLREKIIDGKAPGLTVQERYFLDTLVIPSRRCRLWWSYCITHVIYRKSHGGVAGAKGFKQAKMSPEDAKATQRAAAEDCLGCGDSYPTEWSEGTFVSVGFALYTPRRGGGREEAGEERMETRSRA